MADAAKPLRLTDLPWFTLFRWIQEEGHPFTGSGVAALARGAAAWLVLWQLATAICVAVTLGWSLHWAWAPSIETALAELPLAAGIRSGRLVWPESAPRELSHSPWLEVRVDPTGQARPAHSADVQAELQPDRLRLRGALGHVDIPFPADLDLPLGRIEATARWHAWKPFLIAVAAAVGGLLLLPCWWILSLLYTPAISLAGWILRRGLSPAAAWRLAGGALLPGAAVATLGLIGYAGGLYRIPGLLLVQGLHLLIGWIWILWALAACPRPEPPPRGGGKGDGPDRRKRRGRANPFAG